MQKHSTKTAPKSSPRKQTTPQPADDKVLIHDREVDRLAYGIVSAGDFDSDSESTVTTVALMHYLWLSVNKKLLSDTPYQCVVEPEDLIRQIMRGIIARLAENEELERFGNAALNKLRAQEVTIGGAQ
jgi:hypothetical protein